MKRDEWKSDFVVIKIEMYEAKRSVGRRRARRVKDGNGAAYITIPIHKDRAHARALDLLAHVERWVGVKP